ncbi:MAG: hypothetical protein QNJ67_12690 [Kiloniellales bacterium]|nr:hypothetical protein [Kiloniellales bacterium]
MDQRSHDLFGLLAMARHGKTGGILCPSTRICTRKEPAINASSLNGRL